MSIEVFHGKPATDEEMKEAGLTVMPVYEGTHDWFAPSVDEQIAQAATPEVKVVYVERAAPIEVVETTRTTDGNTQTYDLDTIF